MAVSVNLCSKREGEIKKFLESYYEKRINMDSDVERWIYIYNEPLDAIDIISVFMDNSDKYNNILMYIEMDTGDVHAVTHENHNDIIKGFFTLFYKERV